MLLAQFGGGNYGVNFHIDDENYVRYCCRSMKGIKKIFQNFHKAKADNLLSQKTFGTNHATKYTYKWLAEKTQYFVVGIQGEKDAVFYKVSPDDYAQL